MRFMYLAGVSAIVLSTPAAAAAQTQRPPVSDLIPAASPAADLASARSSATGASATLATAPAGQAPADSATTVGEVMVTATRRSDSIRNVPVAVTAVTDTALKAGQIANLSDLAATIPNVQISTFANSANIAIRGIGNGQFNAGADTGVAVHVDGVYLGQSILSLATLNDVQRVEVLRGPQGTLFGRNATGGAVNIIPARPTADLHYGFDTSVGVDPTLVRSSAFVSGPIASGLRGRLSVQQNYNAGYTRNLLPTAANSPTPRRLDDVDSIAARAQLEVGDASSFAARLSLEYMKDRGSGPAVFLVGTPSGVLPSVVATAPRGGVGERETFSNYGSKDNEAKFATIVSTLALGGGELKATASYGETRVETLSDGDGTGVDHTSTYYLNRARQGYGELIYASDATRPLSLIAGVNYFHERLTQDVSVPISTLPPPLDVLGAVTVNLGGLIKSTSYAGFGQLQYRVGERLRLFGGARFTHDRKSAASYNNFGISPTDDSESWERVTYEAGASYQFGDRLTGYAKYGAGYKGGGYSAGASAIPFNPETNTNLEVGLKGTYFDGVLQANLSAFRMKYKNLQVNQIVGALVQVTNAARATINGVEAEVQLRPVTPLRLELNGAWLDATFDEFFTRDDARPTFLPDTRVVDGVPVSGIELAGNRLPAAPKFNASLGGYYDVPVASGTVTLGARYDWKSRLYFSEFNIPLSSQKPAGKLNLYLRYASEDGRWNASLFALNVTDVQIRENVTVVSALIGSLGIARYQPGRQVGASLGFRF